MWTYDDGGREAAGFKGKTSDCVTRAIAIAAERPYIDVYRGLDNVGQELLKTRRKNSRIYQSLKKHGTSPRNGVFKEVYRLYLERMGWKWTPTMGIGTGTTVHLLANELPGGRIIAVTSRHIVAVIDGIIHDTHDPAREGTRAVYGYWTEA